MESDIIKVLLVDDDQGDFEMTRAMLSQAEHGTFELDWVSTFEEAVDAFREGKHDAYLLDYFLEDRTGLDLLQKARTHGIGKPIIILTGRGRPGLDAEAMSAGAADYLVKGQVDPAILEESIRSAIDRSLAARALRDSEKRSRAMEIPTESGDEGFPRGEDRFRALLEHSGTGIASLDMDGFILDANFAFARIFSSSAAEMEGLRYADLLTEDEQPAVVGELDALARGIQSTLGAERLLRDGEGKEFRARSSMSLIRSREGRPDQILVFLERVWDGP